MKLLAIESSALVASCAIYENGVIKAEYTTNFKKTHSQTLMPMIEQTVKMTETKLSSLDAIAISAGPGSFTGLRIGSATAKGLGLALNKPLIHVPTLDAMAYNFYGSRDLIIPIMDARRGQVYAGIYTFEESNKKEKLRVLKGAEAIGINELLEQIDNCFFKGADREYFSRVIFLGDAVPIFKEQIIQNSGFDILFAAPNGLYQGAASVATLAAEYYMEGKLVDADDESPDYLRPSQAERIRAEKEGRS